MDSEFGYEREYKDDDVDDDYESDLDYYGENICEGVCLGGSFIKPMSIINEEEDYNEEDLDEYEEYEDDSNDP
jgi:hypothetical protein